MMIKDILSERKTVILQKWFDVVIDTYPPDTISFLKSSGNRFSNPVGQAIFEGIEGIFNELVNNSDINDNDRINNYLDNIIRIRAVQDFEPSRAVSFIFLLKQVIRDVLMDEVIRLKAYDELYELDLKIDKITVLSFDIYMKCREKLYDLKANEMRNWTYRILQRSNMYREADKQE